MKIDITSMFFNSRIEGQTATPAWGTSIGQNKSRDCRIDDFKQEVVDMVIGMTYKSITDLDNLDVSKGSSDRDVVTCAVFEDIFVNKKKVDNGQYVLLLVREHSKSHDGRLLISYAPYIKYNNIANQSCIDLMQKLLGCSSEGCWFVYDISIKNQSELYFSAVVVNPSAPMVYKNNVKSKNRSEEWKALIPAETRAESITQKRINRPLLQIYYGAPGTGKSHEIKKLTNGKEVIRTTFHPDSDYSTFVGAYKPTTKKVPIYSTYGEKAVEVKDADGNPMTEDRIVYEFVEQAFLQAYIKAWKQFAKADEGKAAEEVYLVVEEINRGNCAQIFGDLFQLLDRGEDGFSEYPIVADKDLQKQLAKAFADMPFLNAPAVCGMSAEEVAVKIRKGEILLLPNNLYIWATMNTSDQSLFPIDSAFKRRWDWKYIPIADAKKNYVIEVDGDQYDWWSFLDTINDIIEYSNQSEDKKLGYFFAKAKDGIISADTFVSKVIFYLWNDVFKDNESGHKAFQDENGGMLAFRKFFHNDGSINTDMVIKFLQDLEVEPFENTAADATQQDGITPSAKRKYDHSSYRVNNKDNLNKAQMTREAFRLYIDAHSDKDANEIAQAWNGLGLKGVVQHLVETEEEFIKRTKDSKDTNKRAVEFMLANEEKIYLSTQFGIDNIGKFIEAVNNAGWNIRIDKIADKT